MPRGAAPDTAREPALYARNAPRLDPKKRGRTSVLGGVKVRPICGALVALISLLACSAPALPGTHAPPISTYDTRASSIVFAYRHGASAEGPFNSFSYNANFSSTIGKLSAQFG